MPDYGGYQPRRPHAPGAWTSVHEAGSAAGGDARFALKVFHPPPSTNIRRLYAIEGWLLAAEKQQRAAKAGGGALEVLACGRCPEGAFAVLPWQERPLEPRLELITARGDLLRALADALLRALDGWETTYGGPHGNLRASNVFFATDGLLAAADVRLSDPWHLPGAKADTLRARDFAAVGALLAQVVRRRAPGGWPIEDAPEWRKLGRAGQAWREYCNFLLDPHAEPGTRTIAEARRRLQRVPRDAKPARTATLAAAAVVVLAAGGVTGYARFGDPQGMPRNLRRLAETTGNPRAFRTEIVAEWALLCRAWSTWLGDLERNAGRWQRTDALWAPDDPLRAAVVKFSAAAAELRPAGIVPEAAKETRLGLLADAPPDAVRKQLLRGTVAERVTDAWTELDGLAKQLETWPRWGELRDLQQQLETRGFARTANALRQRVPVPPADSPVRPDPAALLKAINDVSLDDTGSLLLVQRWGEIARVSAAMAASGDRVQAALPALALADLRDRPSLGDFVDSLAPPLDDLKRRRAQFLDPAVVRDRFLKEAETQAAGGAVTAEDLPKWEAQLALFTLVPAAEDPRKQDNWDDRTETLVAGGADLEAEAPAGDSGGIAVVSRADFDREVASLRTQLASVRARPAVRRDVPALRAELEQLSGAYRTLEQRLDGTLALLRPDRWLQKVAAQTWPFPAVQGRWDAWRQAALGGAAAAQLQNDRDRFRQLRQQERALRAWFDEMLGAEGFGALAPPAFDGVAEETVAALKTLETRRRGEAVAAVVAATDWTNGLPAATWSASSSRGRAPLEQHRSWLAALPAAGAELDRLGALLQDGFGWTEGVEETFAGFSRRAGFEALAGGPAAALAQARRLGELAASNDRTALVGAVQSDGLSVPLTAWRRLGALDGWPGDAAELDIEGALVSALRGRIEAGRVADARKQALLGELSRATRLRWNRAARNAARDAAALVEVFSRMDRYGIAEADLEAPVAYNLALWRLKTADTKETRLGPWRERRDAFLAQVRSLGDGVGARAVERSFFEQLGALPLVEDAAQLAAVTPARAGWTEELVGETERVVATSRDGRVRLEYRLVQPADGTPPFFLATQALAVGDFLHLVNSSGDIGRAVIDALPEWARKETPSKPWNRLTGWQARGDFSGLELSPVWFTQLNAQMQPLLDASDPQRVRAPALDAAVAEKPTARSPLQQVPPEAARIFVERLLGARLATPAEWRAVQALVSAPPAANWRDRGFQELWDFVAQYDQGGVRVGWRPNEGIFLPRVEAAPGAGRKPMADDGRVPNGETDGRLWLAPVDDGPATLGFTHLFGNVWTYLYDPAAKQYLVAGGSALAPRSLDGREPQRVEAAGLIGARRVTEGYADVGVRPAFDAPPGFRARFELLRLVRSQPFLTL